MNRYAFGAALALSLIVGAGCTTSVPQAVSTAVAAKSVTVKGHVALRTPGYKLKAVVAPYTAEDVAYLDVYLSKTPTSSYSLAEATETYMGQLEGCTAELVLANLKMDMDYTVRLEAYKSDGNGGYIRIDDENNCATQFSTTNDDEITGLTFDLQLADQTFRGNATGGVNVTAGEVVDAEDVEELTDASPATEVVY